VRKFFRLPTLGVMILPLVLFLSMPAQTEESGADPASLQPTDDDRAAMEAMLSKLDPEERELVAGLLMELQQCNLELQELRNELATLRLFHKAVVNERDRLRAELARFGGEVQPAPAKLTIVHGTITSVDKIAPLIMAEFKAERAIPVGSTLTILRSNERIGTSKVVLSEGATVVAELAAPQSGEPTLVLPGDRVEYVAEVE